MINTQYDHVQGFRCLKKVKTQTIDLYSGFRIYILLEILQIGCFTVLLLGAGTLNLWIIKMLGFFIFFCYEPNGNLWDF